MSHNPSEMPKDEKPFSIDGPAGRIECIAKHLEQSKGLGIICHPHPLYQGTMHNKVVYTLAKAFNNKGLSTIRFNYRGVGDSEGEFANSVGEAEDLQAVIDWGSATLGKPKLWLAGFSFGSFIAAKGAVSNDVEQLYTVAPAVHHQPYDQVQSVKCPWIVIQGTQDEVVPPKTVYDWFDKQQPKAKGPMQLIKLDATHYYHGNLVILRSFVENTLLIV